MVNEVIGRPPRGFEEFWIAGFAIDHGESIHGPGLSTRPRRFSALPLGGGFAEHFAGGGAKVDEMVGAAIGPHEMLQRFVSVANRHVVKVLWGATPRRR